MHRLKKPKYSYSLAKKGNIIDGKRGLVRGVLRAPSPWERSYTPRGNLADLQEKKEAPRSRTGWRGGEFLLYRKASAKKKAFRSVNTVFIITAPMAEEVLPISPSKNYMPNKQDKKDTGNTQPPKSILLSRICSSAAALSCLKAQHNEA